MPLNFAHINGNEQIFPGSLGTALYAPGSVTVQTMNINGNLTFNAHQALDFRIENVTTGTLPAPGNVGRVVYNTTTGQFLIDNGTAFVPVTATAGVSSVNSLIGAVTLAAGSNVTITPSGNTLTIAAAASPITTGNLTETISNVLTITGGIGAVVGSGTTIDVKQAGISQSGYLSSTDWNTFNNKQPSGSYITGLTGDATASGPGSATLTLATVNSNVGSFINANITVNAKGLITAASNGSSFSITYQQDLFSYSGSNVFTLSFTPFSNSQIVFFNGIGLVSGASFDYVLSGTTLTLNAGIILKAGDQILVVYSH